MAIASDALDVFTILDEMPAPDVAALLLASRPGVTRHDVAALTGESPAEVARRIRAGLLLVRARLDATSPVSRPRQDSNLRPSD